MSKGVTKRIQRSRSVIVAGYVYADVAAEAWRRRLSSHLDQLLGRGEIRGVEQRLSEIRAAKNGASVTLADIFRFVASDLEEAGELMVARDEILIRHRAQLRQARRTRDRLAAELYRELSQTRKFFMGLVRTRVGGEDLDLQGPTPRDPEALQHWAHRAVAVLADPEKAPVRPDAKDGETSMFAQRLSTRRDALRTAISAANTADSAEAEALQAQRDAILAFDNEHLRAARLLESLLDILGLPSLAETVRPGVKRRGRPPKKRPIDVYPDLVERVLGKEDRERALQTAAEKRGGPSSLEVTDLTARAPQEKIEQGPRKRKDAERKIEQGSHKLSKGEEKIEQGSHKHSRDEEKIEQGSRKHLADDRKSGNPLRKSAAWPPNLASVRLTPPERDHRSRRRIVHGLGARLRSRRPTVRSEAPPAAPNTLRQAPATWWQRIIRPRPGTQDRSRP